MYLLKKKIQIVNKHMCLSLQVLHNDDLYRKVHRNIEFISILISETFSKLKLHAENFVISY